MKWMCIWCAGWMATGAAATGAAAAGERGPGDPATREWLRESVVTAVQYDHRTHEMTLVLVNRSDRDLWEVDVEIEWDDGQRVTQERHERVKRLNAYGHEVRELSRIGGAEPIESVRAWCEEAELGISVDGALHAARCRMDCAAERLRRGARREVESGNARGPIASAFAELLANYGEAEWEAVSLERQAGANQRGCERDRNVAEWLLDLVKTGADVEAINGQFAAMCQRRERVSGNTVMAVVEVTRTACREGGIEATGKVLGSELTVRMEIIGEKGGAMKEGRSYAMVGQLKREPEFFGAGPGAPDPQARYTVQVLAGREVAIQGGT